LVKEVNKICENAKVTIRAARHSAQKQIKSDEKRKIIGTSEGSGEMKRVSSGLRISLLWRSDRISHSENSSAQMEEETKKRTAEVDQLFEKAKKQIEQG
jgi:ribosome recycling factor